MRLHIIGAVLSAALAVSGCATILDGTSQPIAVTTTPATGALCTLSNPEGSWSVVTPGTVVVDKSEHNLVVQCSKSGFPDGTASIPSDFSEWTLVNIPFGVVGLGVDAATGAWSEYPDSFQVSMSHGYNGAAYWTAPHRPYASTRTPGTLPYSSYPPDSGGGAAQCSAYGCNW
jgi:hypothetical protein